jgi:hypothetical protein
MITNYLSPTSFVVSVSRMPNVEFFTRRAIIPGVSMTPAERPSPIKNLYEVSDRISYAELDLSFIIDEDMANYIEVLNWMEGIGTPDSTDQFANLQKSKDGTRSDISLIINNSSKNPNIRFDFKECFPISLSPISLDVTAGDIQYPEATVTFRHNGFSISNNV